MKIIALKGPGSSGKSTTLNLVYDELISLGAKVLIPKSALGNPKQRDFECILEYASKKIAFYTMGDFSSKTIEAIDKYSNSLCDVLILATNDKFVKPTAKILTFTNNHIESKTIAIPKNLINIDTANNADKNAIIKNI